MSSAGFVQVFVFRFARFFETCGGFNFRVYSGSSRFMGRMSTRGVGLLWYKDRRNTHSLFPFLITLILVVLHSHSFFKHTFFKLVGSGSFQSFLPTSTSFFFSPPTKKTKSYTSLKMKFTNAVSTLALMAAAVHAAPLAARCETATGSTKTAGAVSAVATGTFTNSTTPTGGSSSNSSTPATGSSSGSISDACDIGFATQNGGTTGGGSAAVTTCTTLEELTACATQDVPAVCLVSGAITGNTVIKVTADTTVGGAAGSSIVGVGFRIINVSNGQSRSQQH